MKDMGVYIYSASGPERINVSLMLMQGQGFMLSADDGTEYMED